MADDLIETGLAGLTAAVTMPEPAPPLAAAAPQLPAVLPVEIPPAPQMPKAPMPDGWNLNKVSALVRDLAQNMYDVPDILKKHGLNEAQYRLLAGNEFFKSALEQFTIDWNTAGNTQKRLALEAAIYLEDGLPNVAARMGKATEPLADVVSLVKVLAEIAGTIGAKAIHAPVAPSERFKIIINLGADTFQRDAAVPPLVQVNPEPSGNNDTLRALLEASGVPSSLQGNRQGS